MERRAKRGSPLELARAEAKTIDECYDGGKVPTDRALRIHVAGDSRTLAGTRLINNAVGRWKWRGGGKVWSYTHAWRHVPREEWSNVSVLASVADVAQSHSADPRAGARPALAGGWSDHCASDNRLRMDGRVCGDP